MDAAMKGLAAAVVLALAVTIVPVARSGHELPVYPSYYPHEIEIATVRPEHTAELLRAGKLHAYIGRMPDFSPAPADSIGVADSLGRFLIVRINPDSPRAKDEPSACAVAKAVVGHLAGNGMVLHPYPVTPLHGDYLFHADLAETAKARFAAGKDGASALPDLKVKAVGAAAKSVVGAAVAADDADWDAEVSDVGAAELVESAMLAMNGWLGPEWLRTGWFQAELMLADAVADSDARQHADAAFRRLTTRDYDGLAERVNLERELVAALAGGCRKVVAGYTVKREYYNAEFSAGIENVAYDALTGLHSPMFIRTVKLKDFPWNGWLALGIDAQPMAAWNPIAGMTDPFGRLMWFALGDPALLPSPYEAGWMLNRIGDVRPGEGR